MKAKVHSIYIMKPTKIVQKLALQDFKLGTERGGEIVPQPVMDIVVKKTKLADDKPKNEGLKCLL